MFQVVIKPLQGYPRSIAYSNKLTGLLKMILGKDRDGITFDNGIFTFDIRCTKSNLLSLIKLIESSMGKIFLDPYYSITWKEI